MSDLFDLSRFDEYKEDNRREVKSAKTGLPESLWETYSSFANTEGGVIILGVKEQNDKSWCTTGLKDASKLEKEFWDLVNNQQKISFNILTGKDVKSYTINGDVILVINVPMAHREHKPIFKGSNMFTGTYRRNGEGDYLCSKAQVLSMLRDQTEDTADMKVVDILSLSDLNQDTIRGYRNMHQNTSERHPFSRLNDDEYLRSIGAAAISEKDGKMHPTGAGLLMFGNDYDIVRVFPEYFLDYQEHLDPSIRWTDRLWSTAGTWSGNVFDFFLRAYNKIAMGLKIPFKMEGILRVDDTPVHKAVREALVNCLSNADYYGVRGVVIKRTPDQLILENPGYIRTGKRQMVRGGVSDPRNKTILKMFSLLDIGERAGSGVPNIFNVWEDQGWPVPMIEMEDSPDRTRVTLIFNELPALYLAEEPENLVKGPDNLVKGPDNLVKGPDNLVKGPENSVKGPENSVKGPEKTNNSDQRIESVLYLLNENPSISRKELAARLNITEKKVRTVIELLKNKGYIHRVGPDKGGKWLIDRNEFDLSDFFD